MNAHTDATLTRADREAPFRVGEASHDPLPECCRLFVEIEDVDIAEPRAMKATVCIERMPFTGEIVAEWVEVIL